MKALTIICNLSLFGFTLFLMVTEGSQDKIFYIIFSIILLITPLISTLVIVQDRKTAEPQLKNENTGNHERGLEILTSGSIPDISATILNLIMLGTSIWALTDQYPHPAETGYYIYAGLVLLTPVLNIMIFTKSLAKKSCLRNLKM